MGISPVTIQTARPTFTAKVQAQAAPQQQAENLTVQPNQYQMKPYQPSFWAKALANGSWLLETGKHAIKGLMYGAVAGGAATGVAAFLTKGGAAISKTKLGQAVALTSAGAGLITGAIFGKKSLGESLKGSVIGGFYGAVAAIPAAITAVVLHAKGKPLGKGIMIAATIATAIAGAKVGNYYGNKEAGAIYDGAGRTQWAMGKK
ncbi:MAG: hypothetical protein AB7V50_01965 [Vampirovibrionia bacterium]